MKPKQIAELIHGGILLAIAVMMAFLLVVFRQMIMRRGISIRSMPWFPVIVIGGIAWLAYRGTRVIIAAWKDVE